MAGLQEADGGADVGGCGEADVETFFAGESPAVVLSLQVADGDAQIHQGGIPKRRCGSVAGSLKNVFWLDHGFAGQWAAAGGFDGGANGGGIGGLQCHGDAHESTAGAYGGDEAIDGRSELGQDFRTRGRLVSGDALDGVELIDVEAGTLLCDGPGNVGGGGDVAAGDPAGGSVDLIDENDFCAQAFEHACACGAIAG